MKPKALRPATSPTPSAPVSKTAHLLTWTVSHRYELVALGLYLFVLIARAPWLVFQGRLWAEEGTMFLQYAWTHSFLDALTAPHAGYYNLISNLAGLLAANAPLEIAPHFTVTLALAIQLLPALLVLFTNIPGLATPLRKAAALWLLLVVPSYAEVHLVTINKHFVLCAATGLVLVSEPGGRLDRIFKWTLVTLAGLSGVVSTFLTPFFWARWWRERQRDRLVQAIILTTCGLLQVILLIKGVADEERHVRFRPDVVVAAFYAKFIASPVAPFRTVETSMERLRQDMDAGAGVPAWIWLATAAGLGAFVLFCWRSRNRTTLLLAACTAWLVLLATPGSREAASDQKLLFHLTGALRYYYAAEFFFFLALLVALQPQSPLPKPLRLLSATWLTVVLLMGSYNFLHAPLDWPMFFFGPPWQQQVEQWRKDPSRPITLWPDSWHLTLPQRP